MVVNALMDVAFARVERQGARRRSLPTLPRIPSNLLINKTHSFPSLVSLLEQEGQVQEFVSRSDKPGHQTKRRRRSHAEIVLDMSDQTSNVSGVETPPLDDNISLASTQAASSEGHCSPINTRDLEHRIATANVFDSKRRVSLHKSPLEIAQQIVAELKTRPGLSHGDKDMLDQVVHLLTSRDAYVPKFERMSTRVEDAELVSDEMENWLRAEFSMKEDQMEDNMSSTSTPLSSAIATPGSSAFSPAGSSPASSNNVSLGKPIPNKETRTKGVKKGTKLQVSMSLVLSTSAEKKLRELFDKIGDWDFDIFALSELTNGRPLFAICYALFLKHDFLRKFHIKDIVMRRWLKAVEANCMMPTYHTNVHAADVVQTTYHLLTCSPIFSEISDLSFFAALIAAAIHDISHPGLNNAFQIRTESNIALTYNDRSVLENYHLCQAFTLCKQKDLNIFEGFSEEDKREVRGIIVAAVLSTDMTHHFSILGDFKAKAATSGLDVNNRDQRTLMIQMALKVADVSNPAKPKEMSRRWTDLIMKEFYTQGDKERALGLPISPFCDRNTSTVAECQHGFIEYIVYPLFEAWSHFAELPHLMTHLNANREYWTSQLNQKNGD
mmetsp:Transcript_19709/g.32305  ORF Transcript_19709/g.32305 Transcript_19709/m.32305 type:complete len:610 (+) Transcript_19709:82-1911(+)|eukprot:CAMPEP_0184671546 /NCGR_PEP_ID=MMETSP0308-20130426/85570_1 /TAXON_ID=38269 /ORGANISM="Gloeochaete witrockiana, Strain SAG 46.84" /LENGTH=609 /DNA_ID=CAMNT_0027118703 /DNA_START=6 /DNA_END=1835 /DNA_ORIENTATION=-